MHTFLRASTLCTRRSTRLWLGPQLKNVQSGYSAQIRLGRYNAVTFKRLLGTVKTDSASPSPSTTSTESLSLPPTTWIDRLPPKIRPYLYLTRIDKPIGTLLLFYPCGKSKLLSEGGFDT